MSMWLYQISPTTWSPNRYRLEIWENERWSWAVGRKTGKGEVPEAGDTIVFFYAPSGGHEPGFYGWAVVMEWLDEQSLLYFRPVAPSDHLKMCPWWDGEARSLADEIRGAVKQGTLWQVPQTLAKKPCQGITRWIGRAQEDLQSPGPGDAE